MEKIKFHSLGFRHITEEKTDFCIYLNEENLKKFVPIVKEKIVKNLSENTHVVGARGGGIFSTI